MKKLLMLLLVMLMVVSCADDANQPDEPMTDPPPLVDAPDEPDVEEPAKDDEPTKEPSPEPAPDPLADLYETGFTKKAYELKRAFEGLSLSLPLQLALEPEQANRIYIVEKGGLVKKVDTLTGSSEVYLDLRSHIDASANEKGLLGFQFHPNYPMEPRVFVNYTDPQGTVIAEIPVDLEEQAPLVEDLKVLLSFDQPYGNHNGGFMTFGPEGYLYIASGDGGGAGDPANNGQNLSNLLGKILRLDVNAENLKPAELAFDQEGERWEIYAYGLRNPWKFSYDPLRDLWLVADVGQNAMEEISILEMGNNYGWPKMEGSLPYKDIATQGELTSPIWTYEHPVGKSITGGVTYYGDKLPSLEGVYLYGDFITGFINGLWINEDGSVQNESLLETGLMISSFGLDHEGHLYVLDYQGGLYELVEKEGDMSDE